ncbi:hypothetical protein BH20VER2_BH20VER2_10490 [soil metagenome]|nr:transcriptional regulator [Chthoniobacterales bacterium]
MRAVKKLEIIVPSPGLREVCGALDRHQITGYSIIHGLSGRSDRGLQSADDLTGVFANTYVLTLCDPERLHEMVEAVRPILKRHGGMCLVTDAQWVIH